MADANLRTPGPTPCREEVLEAVSRPMVNHRGPELAALAAELTDRLKQFLETEHDIALLTASGTGGLEAAVTNTLSPGDRVVGVDAGAFGKRFCSIAEAYGASVRTIEVEWGRALEPDELRDALREEVGCRAVLLTHNETSTGVCHPIEELCRVVREESEALLIVDAVSSLGAIPLSIDTFGIDVVVTGSQKAWGVPPGMAILCVSPRAWDASEGATMPRYYLDLKRYRDGSFPFTPAISVMFGLSVALELMLRETAEGVFSRHARIAERARAGVRALGLELFADESFASPTVTAMKVPASIDERQIVDVLRTRYATVLARGQGRLAGKILRLGHLGWVQEPEIDAALDALEKTLSELGYRG